jgi:hypothetical protein
MTAEPTPVSVETLYRQLVCERAGRARAALAQQANVVRMLADNAQALEEAAAVLLHAATGLIAVDGMLPGMFAEHAGALLAVAARFEEAADVSRSRDGGDGGGGGAS